MFWTSLFLISIAQGIFLISLIVVRGTKNPIASKLIVALLALMILTNFGYLVIRTDMRNYFPQFFAIPFGMMLLFGPLFYFYSRSVLDNSFSWKPKYWLHFIPYFVQVILNIPLFLMDKTNWLDFISVFLAGDLTIRITEKIIFAVQDLQLLAYLIITFRWIQNAKTNFGNAQYIISITARVRWLQKFFYGLALFLFTVFSLYVFILIHGRYNPVTNYIYTLISSGIIYFIAYELVLNPELISPDFIQKYQAYMQFDGADGEKYIRMIESLMTESKIFTNSELKLQTFANELGLPSHQVSKLINEKFGKTFNDFVNEYRVQEFISRINKPEFQSFTIYGIASDVGFNSKSSFHTAFKKITGKTPSEFKTTF
ncbi:MAG TPA: helix-turn-helix domain-containing protein [Bacteroidia bacterium]|nr:helix-turn-helix domain-containing protein [Bacteroidia bacterium]